ncbi:hypothetical protein D3C87_1409170 [compost metagenome]
MARKFGIIGTSCAGKTTLAHSLVGRLKSYGVLADGLFSQDRKFSFDKRFLETEAAQNWMVTNLIAKEVDITLHTDVDVFITDRTPIDLFAYYAHQFDTPLSRACWHYVLQWAQTYDTLYYLEPLPFQDDTKRPPDEFRLAVDRKLNELLVDVPNVMRIDRHSVLVDIMTKCNLTKPNVKTTLTETDLVAIAKGTGHTILMKRSPIKDNLSDHDLWVIHPFPFRDVDVPKVKQFIKGLVGAFVPFDVNVAHDTSTFDFPYTIAEP